MEVILTKNIPGLGAKNEVLTVKAGYASNYLIPQGFALIANSANKKVLAENINQHAKKEKKIKQVAENLAKKIADIKLVLSAKVGKKGKIFGTITSLQIAQAYNTQGITIEAKQIKLTEPIKTIGEHKAILTLHKEVVFPIKIEVKAL